MTARLTLLLTTPRVAPGLLSRAAWQALDEADEILGYADEPQVLAVGEAGLEVTALPVPDSDATDATDPTHPTAGMPLGRRLVDLAAGAAIEDTPHPAGRLIVWVGSSDGDPGLTDVVAAEVTRRDDPPEVEVLLGSHDVPGARLLDLVAVMDRLRSPGGCPWDAEQTHTSLVRYLLEEAYEAAEALESGDRRHIVEELGDVLLQVVFHARVGEEDQAEPFDIDDVASAIVTKLVRRHPHVFADGTAGTPAEVEATWESIKAAERAERAEGADGTNSELLHGIPLAMPTLARAAKVVSRLRRAGRADLLDGLDDTDPGNELLELVARIEEQGLDADAELRASVRDLEGRLGERVAPLRQES